MEMRTEPRAQVRVSLTALLGTPVTDAKGHLRGKLKDIVVATGPDGGKVAGLVLKTRTGLCLVSNGSHSGSASRAISSGVVEGEGTSGFMALRCGGGG